MGLSWGRVALSFFLHVIWRALAGLTRQPQVVLVYVNRLLHSALIKCLWERQVLLREAASVWTTT